MKNNAVQQVFLMIFVLLAVSGFSQTKKDYFWSGVKKYNLKDHKGAIADCTKALEIDSTSAPTYYLRGVSKIHLEQKERMPGP
jgi:hypothetical protein